MSNDEQEEMVRLFTDPANGGSAKPPEPAPGRKVALHWENMASLRYWGGAIGTGLVFALLAALIGLPGSSGTAFFWFGFVVSLIGSLAGRRYWCPHCRGMVKRGATVCRHCGREFDA